MCQLKSIIVGSAASYILIMILVLMEMMLMMTIVGRHGATGLTHIVYSRPIYLILMIMISFLLGHFFHFFHSHKFKRPLRWHELWLWRCGGGHNWWKLREKRFKAAHGRCYSQRLVVLLIELIGLRGCKTALEMPRVWASVSINFERVCGGGRVG